jgi:signal peptidase II
MRLRAGERGARIEKLTSAVLVWEPVKSPNHAETEGLRRRAFSLLAGVAAILALDQATKVLAASRMVPGESIEILPGVLHFTLVRNTGMAFGLLSGLDIPFKSLLMTVLSLAALAAVIYYALRSPRGDSMTYFGLVFILGGALGNIVDRARLGYVIDFVDVFYRDAHWPAFNVADSSICVGVGLLLLDSLRHHEPALEAEPGVAGGSGTGESAR